MVGGNKAGALSQLRANPGSAVAAPAPAAAAPASASHSSNEPGTWLTLSGVGVFAALYVLLAWLDKKRGLREDAKISTMEEYLLKLATWFVAIVLAVNLGKIVTAKLILWTAKVPFLGKFFKALGKAVGNV